MREALAMAQAGKAESDTALAALQSRVEADMRALQSAASSSARELRTALASSAEQHSDLLHYANAAHAAEVAQFTAQIKKLQEQVANEKAK